MSLILKVQNNIHINVRFSKACTGSNKIRSSFKKIKKNVLMLFSNICCFFIIKFKFITKLKYITYLLWDNCESLEDTYSCSCRKRRLENILYFNDYVKTWYENDYVWSFCKNQKVKNSVLNILIIRAATIHKWGDLVCACALWDPP